MTVSTEIGAVRRKIGSCGKGALLLLCVWERTQMFPIQSSADGTKRLEQAANSMPHAVAHNHSAQT